MEETNVPYGEEHNRESSPLKNIAKQLAKKGLSKYVTKKLLLVKSPLLLIVLLVLLGIILLFAGVVFLFILLTSTLNSEKNIGSIGISSVSESTIRWKSRVEHYAKLNEIPQYTNVILAIIQQESGGNGIDIMQTSEAYFSGQIGQISSPEQSLELGIMRFAQLIKKAKDENLYIAIQAYNMGNGFIDMAISMNTKGKDLKSVEQAAISYATKYGQPNPTCSRSWQVDYCYGDTKYVEHVIRYLTPVWDGKGDGPANKKFNDIIALGEKFLGDPYLLGGIGRTLGPGHPIDCSGFIEYVYNAMEFNLSGTAQTQYDKTIQIDKPAPGDLVFFEYTYNSPNRITHVGIYVGNNRMIHAGGDQVHYADLSSAYYQKHFAGFRRIKE